jgi:hypothetical protein
VATEVWFRNPNNYIRELIEVGTSNIVWDRGFVYKRKIDPVKFAKLYSIPAYRMLLVGDQGSAEFRPGDELDKPCAVYPTWMYGNPPELLEELMMTNVADVEGACTDPSVPEDLRPHIGQEHRVIVANIPPATTGPSRKFLRHLQELQEEYPDCILHVHGLYSYRLAFGMGYGAADMESRSLAQKGHVMLPNGKDIAHERTVGCSQWVTLLGMSPVELAVPRNRCMYNIRSAMWAGAHWDENIAFKSKGKAEPDTTSAIAPLPTTARVHSGIAQTGDKFHCDTCSLQTTCKYFRSGGVCSIPDSEPASLARMFKTRDSDMIIEGLGTLLAAQTRRLERGIEDEDDMGELDPEVTKIINTLFANGVKLAKLVNPALAGGPKVGVFVQGNGAQVGIAGANPKALVSAMVAELEARGISRDKITPDMIAGLVAGPEREVIDAVVVEETG